MAVKQQLECITYRLQDSVEPSIEMFVDIDIKTQTATIRKTDRRNGDRSGEGFRFVGSDPSTVKKIGELIAKAGKLAEQVITKGSPL